MKYNIYMKALILITLYAILYQALLEPNEVEVRMRGPPEIRLITYVPSKPMRKTRNSRKSPKYLHVCKLRDPEETQCMVNQTFYDELQ